VYLDINCGGNKLINLFNRKKPKFSPDLIDLMDYEKNLLYAREHDKNPRLFPLGRIEPLYYEVEKVGRKANYNT